jgi:CDP-diacylglycerol---serine O-phosphatidyltransferase
MGTSPLSAPRLTRLIPNAITVTALCTGLSSIRFALVERWELAVSLILIAAILDAMDGRVARFLRADSPFGAELDSLSDFISFGVAPAVVLYLYSLHFWQGLGWAVALFFATCMALRLARFNTHMMKAQPEWTKQFSVGVPAPAGAFLALLPLMITFACEEYSSHLPFFFAVSLCSSGLLMISRIPTYLLKNMRIPHTFVRLLLMMVAVFMAAFFTAPWWTISFFAIVYLFSIPVSGFFYKCKNKEAASKDTN